MEATVQSWTVTGTLAALALILIGGTIGLLVMGKPVPEFLVGFDGVIITAAYGHGTFFVMGQSQVPVTKALSDTLDKYHQLAIAGTVATNHSRSGGTEPIAMESSQ